MKSKFCKEIRDWSLIALFALFAYSYDFSSLWLAYHGWQASRGVWIEPDIEDRVG